MPSRLRLCSGAVTEAQKLYAELAADFPNDHRIPVHQGHIFNAVGDSAIASFKRASALKPTHGDSYWSFGKYKVLSIQQK